MGMSCLRATRPWLICCCLVAGLQAGEWELGASLSIAQEEKGKINALGGFPTVPYTTVQNNFNGLWYQGGLQVGYKVFSQGPWGVWLQAQYSEGLSHPGLFHKGESVTASTTLSEKFSGNATYHSLALGVALTRRFQLGEIGLSLGRRGHALSVEGDRESRTNTSFTYDRFSTSHSYDDVMVGLSFTTMQDQGDYRFFQKLSFASGFGSSIPAVNPGPGDWKMSEAYLAQIRPSREVRITLGFRR